MDYYETSDGRVPALAAPPGYERVFGAWWTPSSAFVDELAKRLVGRRVLEVFAGNGYLASLLNARGIAVTATSHLTEHDGHTTGLYYPVIEMEATEAVSQLGDEHDVLLFCWPTPTRAPLRAAAAWGPERLIVFIGEVTDYEAGIRGGCATDEFFEHVQVRQRIESYVGNSWEQAFIGQFNSQPIALPGKDTSSRRRP